MVLLGGVIGRAGWRNALTTYYNVFEKPASRRKEATLCLNLQFHAYSILINILVVIMLVIVILVLVRLVIVILVVVMQVVVRLVVVVILVVVMLVIGRLVLVMLVIVMLVGVMLVIVRLVVVVLVVVLMLVIVRLVVAPRYWIHREMLQALSFQGLRIGCSRVLILYIQEPPC